MSHFIKTVTKEVVDVAAISMALKRKWAELPLLSLRTGFRLVMSSKTKEAIKSEFAVPTSMSTVATVKAADYFEGHPVDINDSLEFGEVLFTFEA